MSMRRYDHDIGIYAPFASALLTDPPQASSGGAELQATLLARGLARRGLDVAQIVYPNDGLPPRSGDVTLVQRPPSALGSRGGPIREPQAIWGALHRASARTYVNRSAGLEVFLTASYCRFNRRNFIYSSSSTFDFTGEYLSHSRRDTFLFNAGLRMADAVVVQTRDQERLARHRGVRSLVMAIPSFVEPGTVNSHREHLLWVGNSYYYKQPKAFVELARQVPHARCVMVLTERTSPPDAIRAAEIVQEAEQIANLTVRSAMPRDEVLELIGRSVAVVNTSIGEGMPNIFLEAWARGVPALSLAVDPDTLIQTEGLGIAANGDWTRFVQGARSLWDDGSGALAAGRRGRELVRDRHDPERVAEQWTEVAEAVQAPDRA